jgi:hypothetical protein
MKIYPAFEIGMPENETDRDGGLAPYLSESDKYICGPLFFLSRTVNTTGRKTRQ